MMTPKTAPTPALEWREADTDALLDAIGEVLNAAWEALDAIEGTTDAEGCDHIDHAAHMELSTRVVMLEELLGVRSGQGGQAIGLLRGLLAALPSQPSKERQEGWREALLPFHQAACDLDLISLPSESRATDSERLMLFAGRKAAVITVGDLRRASLEYTRELFASVSRAAAPSRQEGGMTATYDPNAVGGYRPVFDYLPDLEIAKAGEYLASVCSWCGATFDERQAKHVCPSRQEGGSSACEVGGIDSSACAERAAISTAPTGERQAGGREP